MDVDGANVRRTTNADGWGPTWSPDGNYLAFSIGCDSAEEVRLVDPDTDSGDVWKLADGWGPVWAPA